MRKRTGTRGQNGEWRIEDRMEKLETSDAYITVKDHKEDFNVSPSFRLINPSKTDIGRVSKQMLDDINRNLLLHVPVNQWKNTHAVIDWFKDIPGKRRCTFLQYDIEQFYPSISAELFEKAITFAKQYIDIPDTHLRIIRQARHTLLFHQGDPWMKRNGDEDFDVPMGSYDGAEVCELIGIFMLSQISQVVNPTDNGLYRDDGLAVMRNIGKPEIERRKKKIIQIFKSHKLKITIRANLQIVQYLDVELDLKSGQFRPYRKPNSDPLYINRNSNHPPSVLKQVPASINRRLSDISSSAEVFDQAAPAYEAALRNSGFDTKLAFEVCDRSQQKSKRKRRRKTIWYNPPYSSNVKTNVARKFLSLLCQHFHKKHRLHKIFNTMTVKVSYCCTRNVSSIISGHNKYVLRQDPEDVNTRTCNCRRPEECPMGGRCLAQNIIYKGNVENLTDSVVNPYIGLTMNHFKERYGVHKQGINNRAHASACELTKHVWNLKDNNKVFSINWDILQHVKGRLVGGECKLCVAEKLHIIEYPDQDILLNSHSSIKCMHKAKRMLSQVPFQGRGRPRRRVDHGITSGVT